MLKTSGRCWSEELSSVERRMTIVTVPVHAFAIGHWDTPALLCSRP